MEIIDNRKNATMFGNIHFGEVFFDTDGDYLIKIIGRDSGYNAVDLTSGCLYSFPNEDMVTPLNVKMVIED